MAPGKTGEKGGGKGTGGTGGTGGKGAGKGQESVPATLRRSSAKAQRTYRKTLESAHQTYGDDEERARRTAMAAVKHSFEKVGDHWEPKAEKGPSDPQAARGGAEARRGGETAGGVDVFGHSKQELYERARRLGIRGRSSMSKEELGKAIAKRQ